MKKAVVTGVAGFIGSTLAEQLLEDGVEVVGIDCFSSYYPLHLKTGNVRRLQNSDAFRLVETSLLDGVADAIDGADVIFHQAGQPGVRPSWGSTFESYSRENILATQRLLETIREVAPSARLVYASSSSVYGEAERYPTLESDRPQPLSPYGVTKLAAEHLVGLYARNFGIQGVSLRYFTVYGPRQRPDMAFTRFIMRALTDRQIDLYGSGEQIRDFTYVSDIVAANIAAATADVNPGSVFNVSGGSSVSVNEVLSTLEQIVGKPLKIQRHERALGDVLRTGGDSSLAREQLSWSPVVPLHEGLVRQVDWASQNIDAYERAVD
jgi:nucleoside-diphosphate-sugar epimerase